MTWTVSPSIRCRRRSDRRGTATVELAVVTPLLVSILFAIAQFGSVFYARHTMIHASREGARQMAIEGATESEARTIVEEYLSNFGVHGATVTVQNAYKGGGDDAEARQVRVQTVMPSASASILGDVLNVFGAAQLEVNVSMRKEGELVAAPIN